MKRGDLVAVALSGDYGKPRPALVVQADQFAGLPSVTVLPLTSEIHDEHLVRITIEPSLHTGLRVRSQVMVDKISTVPQGKVRGHIGQLDTITLRRVNGALAGFLGLL